jgi:hypothetical protein
MGKRTRNPPMKEQGAPTYKERRHPVGCRSRDILSRVFPHTTPSDKMSAIQQRATCTRSIMYALRHARSADILSAAGRGTSCPASSHIQTRRTKCPPSNSAQHARAPSYKERRHPVGCRSRDILSRLFPYTDPPDKMSAIQQRATCTRSDIQGAPTSCRLQAIVPQTFPERFSLMLCAACAAASPRLKHRS